MSPVGTLTQKKNTKKSLLVVTEKCDKKCDGRTDARQKKVIPKSLPCQKEATQKELFKTRVDAKGRQ